MRVLAQHVLRATLVAATLAMTPPILFAEPAAPAAPAVPAISDPVELRVPAAGIDAAVESVGTEPDGSMGVPSNFSDAAWFSEGYLPGQDGRAVFDGHVSSVNAAAVFFHVEDLPVGAKVVVTGADGTELTFRVTDVEQYPMDSTPMDVIFGPSDRPEVVLITCGGGWHEDVHLFDHRTVAYAALAGS
jgi:sortase (surface protein transpeptidase)